MTQQQQPVWYEPPAEPVKITSPDDLRFEECFRIKAATGVDVMKAAMENDYTSLMVAILWHIVSQKPEYAGITYGNVRAWPMSKIAMDEPLDSDADDVRETLREMDEKDGLAGVNGDGTPFTDPSGPESE